MKYSEIASGLRTFRATIKLPQKGYSTLIDTQVVARNYELARRLLVAQYGKGAVVSNVTEVR